MSDQKSTATVFDTVANIADDGHGLRRRLQSIARDEMPAATLADLERVEVTAVGDTHRSFILANRS